MLKTVVGEAEAADELERAALFGLFFQMLPVFGIDGVEFVTHADVFALFVVHNLIDLSFWLQNYEKKSEMQR